MLFMCPFLNWFILFYFARDWASIFFYFDFFYEVIILSFELLIIGLQTLSFYFFLWDDLNLISITTEFMSKLSLIRFFCFTFLFYFFIVICCLIILVISGQVLFTFFFKFLLHVSLLLLAFLFILFKLSIKLRTRASCFFF